MNHLGETFYLVLKLLPTLVALLNVAPFNASRSLLVRWRGFLRRSPPVAACNPRPAHGLIAGSNYKRMASLSCDVMPLIMMRFRFRASTCTYKCRWVISRSDEVAER
jgi:hypothetical protein